MHDELLMAEDISCSYGPKEVLKGLSFTLRSGRITGLLGANGCGKTTLLKCIGSTLPYKGRFAFCKPDPANLADQDNQASQDNQANQDNQPTQNLAGLTARHLARLISYIPQQSGVTIDLSVLDLVLMGFNPYLSLLSAPSSAMRAQALDYLDKLGLKELAASNFQELSQGQKQLCLFARALVAGAPLLLLDEPESALDFGNRYAIFRLLRKYLSQSASGPSAALVSLHDPQLALNYCDEILIIRDGLILSQFEPASTQPDKISDLLSAIYGPLLVTTCQQAGKDHFVILPSEDNYGFR